MGGGGGLIIGSNILSTGRWAYKYVERAYKRHFMVVFVIKIFYRVMISSTS